MSTTTDPATTLPPIEGIRGPRIRLVPMDRALHLENYLRWFNDPEVTRFLSRNLPISRLAEEAYFERQQSHPPAEVVWAVHDEDDRHIGATGLHGIDWIQRSASSGTVIGDKGAWRKGYGAEVMRVRTRWAFQELGLRRIESECFAENEGSATCLSRAGYRRIGTAREKYWRGGRWHDAILWEVLAADWREHVRSQGLQEA